jgi:hypothetical protein
MAAIGRSSHALFFDGVTDSVVLPQGSFNSVGLELPEGVKSPIGVLSGSPRDDEIINQMGKYTSALCIEAWVIPDCGGIIAQKEGQFKLQIGNVDTAGPAIFTVQVEGENGLEAIRLTTATDASTRYSGTVYPTFDGGIHDSYNRFIGSSNDATNLNINHRPLMHIVAGIKDNYVVLFINGELMAKAPMPNNGRLGRSSEHIYLGGKGGEFRGTIESIHFSNRIRDEVTTAIAPLASFNTMGLYRFEEPIDIIENTYTITALGSDSSSVYSAAADGTTTTITVSAAEAQALILKLTGKAHSTFASSIVDFTAKPYSMGNYKVVNYVSSPGSASTMAVPHVPYNLLINPGAINQNTQKPNQKPPERVRLHGINGSTGVLTVSSIHVDFDNMATSAFGSIGLRGVLHDRTANVDDYFVVIASDLLIDNGTGQPYQPPHYGSQIFDTTGQMILDESQQSRHGLIYSSKMATTTNSPTNPFAVVWPTTLDELYQIGHSGRHYFSHVKGHEFMRRYPKPHQEIVDQSIDGSSDITELVYEPSFTGLEDLIKVNSRVDIYHEQATSGVVSIVNSTDAGSVYDNGLPTSAAEMIAL